MFLRKVTFYDFYEKEHSALWDYRGSDAWTVKHGDTNVDIETWWSLDHPYSLRDAAAEAILTHFRLPPAAIPPRYVVFLSPQTLAYLARMGVSSKTLDPILCAVEVRRNERQTWASERIPSAEDAESLRQTTIEFREAVEQELIRQLAEHPAALYELAPRKFEEVVAALLADMGADVQITPATRDGGRDILAAIKTPMGYCLWTVECKRYAASRKIGDDILRSLLFVMDRYDLASNAMLVTTSFFTKDAVVLASKFKWRLALQDFDSLTSWLKQYGRWAQHADSHLWLAKRPGQLHD